MPLRQCSRPSAWDRSTNSPTRRFRAGILDALSADGVAPGLDHLPQAATEEEALAELRALANANTVAVSMIGQGYFDTLTPPVLRRNILENPAWYTAYTPYQPEISQGRLEALLNFQTMVADLTGLEVANASMLDEGTAAAEAMTLMHRAVRGPSNRLAVDTDVYRQTAAVLATRAEPLGIEIVTADLRQGLPDGEFFGVIAQLPGASGAVVDWTELVAQAHERGALVALGADLLALTVVTPPGEIGADVAFGSTQRFGVPMGFGGPHAGYLAVHAKHARQLPGRLVGVSVDCRWRTGVQLVAADPRAAHPPRQGDQQYLHRAGAAGRDRRHVRELSRRRRPRRHCAACARTCPRSWRPAWPHRTSRWFTAHSSTPCLPGCLAGPRRSVTTRRRAASTSGWSTTTTCRCRATRPPPPRMSRRWCRPSEPPRRRHRTSEPPRRRQSNRSATSVDSDFDGVDIATRTSEFLTHPAFTQYRTETEMMRYLRSLADKDIALDRSMIPLGSCTMKLNAAAEMEPISWPEFARQHPFSPASDTPGLRKLIADLETWLTAITGYDAVSLQPNAGSQGEYAGLLAIQAYHAERGQPERDVCLIPSSAHGTNAASAALVGMRVVVVACRANGDVDLDDLRSKVAEHADRLSALMITYPSTHGVYEHDIADICAAVHDVGGQVYVDGANLNALVGLARPGRFGGDVSHLNLHKTFCIPHGGGGPGVGPVAVRAHLAPYLPGHPLAEELPEKHTVSSAPYGSASILPITWAYIRMMGAGGLRAASLTAIASANYIARRLDEYYPVLYTGENGMVAHECILDLRGITKATGVTVDDVAKRLADYGFHAPTMSFPVAGTLMVEPTESESLTEVDAFCEAMIAIRAEIDQVGGRDAGLLMTTRCGVRRTRPSACWWPTGITRTPANRRPIRWARDSGPRCGRRCAASTAPTATAIWCARARRWRHSREVANRSLRGVACRGLVRVGRDRARRAGAYAARSDACAAR